MTVYTWINIAMAAYLIVKFITGWRKGVIGSLLSTLGSFLCLYGAYLLSGHLAEKISLYPADKLPLQGTIIADAIYPYLNRIVWFVILFVILKVVLMLVEALIRAVRKLPGIHFLSGLCGGLFGLLTGALVLGVVCILLHLPIISNGTDLIENTGLSYVDAQVQKAGEKYLGDTYETYLKMLEGDTSEVDGDTIAEAYQSLDETQKEEVTAVLNQYGISDIQSLQDQYDSLSEEEKDTISENLEKLIDAGSLNEENADVE